MKKISTFLIAAAITCASPVVFTNTAFAGGSHEGDHAHSHGPISSNKAASKAKKKIQQLVEKGKIDKSWAGVDTSTVEKKQFGKKTEWVVSFNNDKIADKAKQALYVFFTLDGNYLAANYTGK